MTVGNILNFSFVGAATDIRLAKFSLTASGAGVDIITGTKSTPAVTALASTVLSENDYFAYYPDDDNLYIRIGD